MKEICKKCHHQLILAPADYSIRHMYCENYSCDNYGLLAITWYTGEPLDGWHPTKPHI